MDNGGTPKKSTKQHLTTSQNITFVWHRHRHRHDGDVLSLSNTWSIWSPKGFLGIFVIWALPSLGLCLVQQSHVVEQDIVIL